MLTAEAQWLRIVQFGQQVRAKRGAIGLVQENEGKGYILTIKDGGLEDLRKREAYAAGYGDQNMVT